MSFDKDLKDDPEFGRFSKAHSPPRPEFEKMTPEELEELLEANIPRAPSWTDRAKRFIGMKSPTRYDARGVRIAQQIAQSRHDRTERNKRNYEDSVIQKKANEQKHREMVEANRLAEIRYAEQKKRDAAAAQAARARARFPRNPIRQADINAARNKYEDLRWAAQRSATTASFVPPENAYDVRSTQRDAARMDLEALEARFAEQERKYPGAQFVAPVSRPRYSEEDVNGAFPFVFGIPPRPGARDRGGVARGAASWSYEGGKSKRVKSKRNKRSTKRRNAHK